MPSLVFALIFFCLCVYAGVKDTISFTIPNWLNLALVIAFVPAAFASQIGWYTAGTHILAGAIALIAAFGLFAVRMFGGGDAKMIPGIVLWVGPSGALYFVLGMAFIGGVLSIIVLAARQLFPAAAAPGFARKILDEKNGIPYGVAIAAGAMFAAEQSPLLIDFVNMVNGLH